MLTPDFYIDGIQNAKVQFVNTFVTNDSMKKNMLAYVEAQREFAKSVVRGNKAFGDAVVKFLTNATTTK